MNPIIRAALLVSLSSPFLIATAQAQPAPLAESLREWPQTEMDRPWIYRGSDVPPDTEWRFGELSNGLRYAVRFNEVPQDQISVRVRIDAGSMAESDEERGFAHLLEHLTFRESRYLKEGETIPRWEQLGATFGSDTNAQTTPTQTVYKLDVPDMNEAKLDETFRLLSGMIIAPTLSDKGVATEVPIVLAEMRESGGAGRRVADASRETYFSGQPLAERAPIGTVATLRAATGKSVRAFHQRWYRPDNTVIVVAGDAPQDKMVELLEKYFGGWKVAGPTEPVPDFGKPVAEADALVPAGGGTPVGKATVVVEPDLPRSVGFAVLRPWEKVADTIVYNQGLLIDSMAQALINRRLEARARAGGSYLQAAVAQEDVNRSADATFVSITPLGKDWQAALRDVRAVIADALATPPSEAEIAREYAEFENAFAIGVETREVMQASDLADNVVSAVDIRETVAAPETVLNVLRGMRDRFTPQALLDHTRKLFSGSVQRGLMVVPDAGEADAQAFRAAMAETVAPDGSARVDAAPISFDTLPPLGKPGTLVASAPAGVLEVEYLALSNGVRAMIWPNDAEPGRVNVRVRFGNGYGAFTANDAPYVSIGEMALMGSGIGPLDQDDLDRISTGRKMGLDFRIADDEFVFSADTRAADLEDQLYLFAAKLAMPRWDANPFERAKAALGIGYASFSANPGGVLERDLEYLLRGKDPRVAHLAPDQLEDLTPQGFRKVWEPVLASGPVQVEIFGDFDRAQGIAALERTFGALAPRDPAPAKPQLSHFPTDRTPVTLYHRGDANQAAAVIAWPTGGGRDNIRISRQLEVLSQVFNNRLFDAMRERLGASYAPSVSSRWPLGRKEGGMIIAMAQIQPEATQAFFEEARRIAAELAAAPPTADEVGRVTEPLRQLINRAASGNSFWMNQLAGSARDPERVEHIRSLLSDYTGTRPEVLHELAKVFLAPDDAFTLSVLPEKAE